MLENGASEEAHLARTIEAIVILEPRSEIAPPPPAIDLAGEDLASAAETWTALPDVGETAFSAGGLRRGTDYLHARFRSPLTGRFLSVDPAIQVGRAQRMPQLWNRYAYGVGNPLRYVDPTGRTAAEKTVEKERKREENARKNKSILDRILRDFFNIQVSTGNVHMVDTRTAAGIQATAKVVGTIAAVAAVADAAASAVHWGKPETLQEHFEEHGGDFGATGPDDYARQASDFLRRSQAEGLPTKIDEDGVIRTYDPDTNTFGSYNPDGTTRTFFKPTSPTYWDRQPGNAPWIPK